MSDQREYVVLFPADDETAWAAGSEADHQATFVVDAAFARALAERGGAVTGGAGLAPSRLGRTLTRGPGDAAVVTEGPYAEAVEQLSGFFLVRCDDHDALVDAARLLLAAHPVVEIRLVEG